MNKAIELLKGYWKDNADEIEFMTTENPQLDFVLKENEELKEAWETLEKAQSAEEDKRSYTKEDLEKAFEAGEEFNNECFCNKCDYCIETKGEKAKNFELWYAAQDGDDTNVATIKQCTLAFAVMTAGGFSDYDDFDQHLKSRLTGLPMTQVIDGELIVKLK